MNWRQWIGLRPTQADLAHDLLRAARQSGQIGWVYDAADSSLRNAARVVNLPNMHREYARAAYLARPGLLRKYRAMLAPESTTAVPNLWTLAQKAIFPILRSGYDRTIIDIQHRTKDKPLPPRAAQLYLGHLDVVIGYDHGQTISQVAAEKVTQWGVPLEEVIERARANLRALPPPTWAPAGTAVWILESPAGYNESLLQLPNVFAQLPAQGTPLAMIPNRGVLLATGSDEPGGLAALLSAAKESIQKAPWPLSGDLFRITTTGRALHVPSDGPAASLSSTIQRLDIAGVYSGQKAALDTYYQAINEDIFVATYGLLALKDRPDEIVSWCSWTQGVTALLRKTDRIAFVWDIDTTSKHTMVSWADAERPAGHYFSSTTENSSRCRVEAFPTADELADLQKVTL